MHAIVVSYLLCPLDVYHFLDGMTVQNMLIGGRKRFVVHIIKIIVAAF